MNTDFRLSSGWERIRRTFLFGDYQKSAPNDAITFFFGLEKNPSGVMISPLFCHQSRGGGQDTLR